jgi:hypothetical protein
MINEERDMNSLSFPKWDSLLSVNMCRYEIITINSWWN